MSRLIYIFVHGLSGWGSYDESYKKMPYWGMKGGDLMPFLRERGFPSYAASVSPTGSAWDRACELYAQIFGLRTDYGEAHSRAMAHGRFGRDFSECPLVPELKDDDKLVLLGHSFGGATVRVFSDLMAKGDAREQELHAEAGLEDGTGIPEISPLFEGGMADRIFALVTLASPMNGTTAYDMFDDPDFDPLAVRVPAWSKMAANMMSMGIKPHMDSRDKRDYASFDMHIDNALKMNREMRPLPGVYYFSVPCSASKKQEDGSYRPAKDMEPLFVMRSYQMGAYKGKTRGGFAVDEDWRENDGLVNTCSARAPYFAPWKELDKEDIRPGIWNVLPTVQGDHMWLQGGLTRKHDIKDFYLELLDIISGIK